MKNRRDVSFDRENPKEGYYFLHSDSECILVRGHFVYEDEREFVFDFNSSENFERIKLKTLLKSTKVSKAMIEDSADLTSDEKFIHDLFYNYKNDERIKLVARVALRRAIRKEGKSISVINLPLVPFEIMKKEIIKQFEEMVFENKTMEISQLSSTLVIRGKNQNKC